DRLELRGEQHGGVGVELDPGAVVAANAVPGTHYDRIVDLALLDATAWRGILHAHLDHVADVRVAALGPAKHLDAHHLAGAGVVSDLQHRLHLDHCKFSNLNRTVAAVSLGPRSGKPRGCWNAMTQARPVGRRRN